MKTVRYRVQHNRLKNLQPSPTKTLLLDHRTEKWIEFQVRNDPFSHLNSLIYPPPTGKRIIDG